MATTGTGQGSSGMSTTDWNSSAGQQTGAASRDRRATGENSTGGIKETLRDSTYRSIDDQKARASDTLGSLAGAVRGMTEPLRDGGQPQIADYVNKAADGIEQWASQLRQQDLEDAVRAVEQFARRQPAMFLGLAFGAGLVAARFLKSSSDQNEMRHYERYDRTTGAGPTNIGSSGFGSPGSAAAGTGGYGTGSSTTSSGDIPRVSGDIRSAGEVL